MANQSDVRRIALALPDVTEEADHPFAFAVRAGKKDKGFVWAWAERVTPGKPRVHNLDVLAVRVPNLGEKEMLLASDPDKFFTEPHYNGFPAVLVRLAAVDVDELAELITDAWRCLAPKRLVKEYDAASG
ncbi:MAG TPA: MmcQ/YjbR family DNA-binding protein [Acidimicrobiales bacterium]|nr:MmcQ/YjbR family DNA-binding protein [Acidimicrobiales bacterium]